MDRTVGFYFDFISPYSWLALTRLESFGALHGVQWSLRPVVYGVLLDSTGLVGPAETDAKRRYTFLDVARSAHELELAVKGPPAHPFRSLEALRTACLFLDDPRALDLIVALANACWTDGRALTDPAVIADVVAATGLDAGGLAGRIAEPEIKQRLRELTEQAIAAGVFGVPTFELQGELFWGHDRMNVLGRRLGGEPAPNLDRLDQVLNRPRGIDRKRAR